MENEPLIQSMLREVLAKIDTLTTQNATIRIDQANIRGEMAKGLLEQDNKFDGKLQRVERRVEEKITTRADKVDGWFDDVAKNLADYKLEMEKRVTTISVRMGLIFSVVTAILVAIATGLIRYFFQ